MLGIVQSGAMVATAVLPSVPSDIVNGFMALCNPFAAAIGLLYLVLSAAACEHGCSSIRRAIHHYERSIERLIGGIYLMYAVHWNELVEVIR